MQGAHSLERLLKGNPIAYGLHPAGCGTFCSLLTGTNPALGFCSPEQKSDESLLVGGEERREISCFRVLYLVSRAALTGNQ